MISLLLLAAAWMFPAKHGHACLADLRWEKRIVILSYAPNQVAQAKQQIADFEVLAASCLERDLILLDVPGRSVYLDTTVEWNKDWDCLEVLDQGFLIELVGKDGGTKMSRRTSISPKVVFDLIDQMPMRQSEMQNQRR